MVCSHGQAWRFVAQVGSLSLTPMDTATVFLYTHRGHTFLADISHLREGKVCVLSPNDIVNLLASVVPIHRAEWQGHQVLQLLEARMRGTATTDGVRFGDYRAEAGD